MEESKLTKKKLLSLEKYVERLHTEFDLSEKTLDEVKLKIALLFKEAND